METKKAYQERKEELLRELGAKIEELRHKAGQSGAEAKLKYREQIESLHALEEAAGKKLKELKGSGENAWEGLKTGVENSLSELRKSIDGVWSRLKKQ